MPSITRDQVKVPVDVSPEMREVYIDNYMKATRETGRLMLFACDQKIEHMNKDFYDGGEDIDLADCEPEHLFRIADQGVCGVMAGQRGLIARYAADYPNINYLVKMNSKTNLVKTSQEDPYSPLLHGLDAVLAMRDSGVNIVGLGYTIYLGSEYEATMMAEAGELIARVGYRRSARIRGALCPVERQRLVQQLVAQSCEKRAFSYDRALVHVVLMPF